MGRAAMPRDLDSTYSYIGSLLTDGEIERLVLQATGKDIYNEWASPNDPRSDKIRKTIEGLNREGNERWLLTYVLTYAAAQDRLRREQKKLRERVVKHFPKALVDLPRADR